MTDDMITVKEAHVAQLDQIYQRHHRDMEDLMVLCCEGCKCKMALSLWRRMTEAREKEEKNASIRERSS